MSANTPTTYYKDSSAVAAACKKDFEKIEKACAKDDDTKPKSRPTFKKLLGSKYKNHSGTLSKGGTDNKSWMADHCDFLWIPPGPNSHDEFLKKLDSLKDDLAEVVDTKLASAMDAAKEKLKQEAIDMAKKKAGQSAARAGTRWFVGASGAAVGGVGGLVTEGIATVWNLWDMASTGWDVAKTGYNAYQELGALDDMVKEFKSVGNELERLGQQAKADPQRAIADFMAGAAKLNPCMRARRCSLVPKGKANNLSGDGCCPGQTGHHLIPDAAVKDAGCPGYDYEAAPTVCAEGTGNSHGGSHQRLHDVLDRRMREHKERRGTNQISYADYRTQAMMAFYETFPESGCSRKCLQAQLDAHYKCSGKSLSAASGKGGGATGGNTGSR
ncbi:hypothetical protein FUT87_13730 [Mitsuaria sp. TWR114]|jgi:hypothetical protein|uniref:HNH/endonuclease VII fold toxin-2 domain-containing protein n=1 Tax=unclassified Roseateles TaxID=2626991 RepID=UPI0008E6B8F8|nr:MULTISPECIES: HNH/endonuclease VII fold toxin-2 domain-containing protein [unclassified Roseateles]MBB3281120.1 hypothetical protein [Mitsuaria sp. BK037]TXD86348.1 hypothetical protein FUT87_13730 [Mitsuaria sp. TWR114]SFR79630.1 GHH signature containing HNH/Endo VII superfamily nuclease toxin 2 [Mitsuaria sp. PDC51]